MKKLTYLLILSCACHLVSSRSAFAQAPAQKTIYLLRHAEDQEFLLETGNEGRALLATVAGGRRTSVQPVPGHVYLVRIEDRQRRRPPVFAKILVVSHVPSDHVTLRWDRIPGL